MNPRIALPLYSVIAFTVVLALAGIVFDPANAWPNVLVSGYFLAGLGISGGFVVAVHDASGGRWLGPVRRIACGLTRLVLPGSLIALSAILFSDLFHHHDLHGFKALWLDPAFFAARAIACVIAWLTAIRFLRKGRGAAAYLVVFGITVSMTAFDWVMALDAHWASTIFAVYHFSGMVTGAMAVIAIVAVHRSRTDAGVTSDHLHDVAKLLFAFSTFWMYIWFSQAMLVWYTNIPEETAHYTRRAFGNWGVLFWAVVAIQWVLPFLALMSEKTKRNRTILSRIAVAVLIGHWLDLYVSIVAAKHPQPLLSGWELAMAFGSFALVGWAVTRREQTATASIPELWTGEEAVY